MIKKIKRYRPKPKKDVEACQFMNTEKSFLKMQIWIGKDFYYNYQNSSRVFFQGISIKKGNWIIKVDEELEGNEYIIMTDAQFKEAYDEIE